MEQGVSLVVVRAGAVGGDDLALTIEVGCVKQLEVAVPDLAAGGKVPPDVVQLAQALRKGDVGVVCEACLAEDNEAVLH